MKLELECYGALCELKTFRINEINADYHDFGYKQDTAPEIAEPYGCGNMQFIPKPVEKEILDKYNITVDEYNEICVKLDCLSFGGCRWCI